MKHRTPYETTEERAGLTEQLRDGGESWWPSPELLRVFRLRRSHDGQRRRMLTRKRGSR